MNEQINIKDLSSERLKAAAYDIAKERDSLNRTLMVIEKELQERAMAEQQAAMATKATEGPQNGAPVTPESELQTEKAPD